MIILGYLLAAVVGVSLGLLGGGGSILTVPIFVYVLGFEAKRAIAMSLPVVGVTSLAGAIGHWRAGRVRLKSAAIFGVTAMLAAYIGARLAAHLSGTVQLVMLAIVMLVAAASMFRASLADDAEGESIALREQTHPALIPVAGAAVGLLTGLLGIGGGFLVVPALVLVVGQPMPQAVGTSLLVITANCAAGFAGYLSHVDVPWNVVGTFTAIAVVGAIGGIRLGRRVSHRTLKRAFAVFLVVTSVFILARNWQRLRREARNTGEPHARSSMSLATAWRDDDIPGQKSNREEQRSEYHSNGFHVS